MKNKSAPESPARGSGPPRRGTSRREFSKAVAAALVAAPVAAGVAASAQTPSPAPAEPKAPPGPQPTPSPAQGPAQPQPSPVAEAYAAVARARFGSQLSDEEFARVKRDIEGNVRTAERLRAFKLGNGDEPDFVFGA